MDYTISIQYENIRFEGIDLSRPWQVFVDIVGLFSIRINAQTLYEEASFPVVEYGRDLQDWLEAGFLAHQEFIYTSVEAEEEGLVRFTFDPSAGWRISAYFQRYEEPRAFDDDTTKAACQRFLLQLARDLNDKFNLPALPAAP